MGITTAAVGGTALVATAPTLGPDASTANTPAAQLLLFCDVVGQLQGDAGLLRLAPAAMFAFSGVMFREILMDMNDLEGDRKSGVWTLPVLLGKPAALCCAMSFMLAGSAAALSWLLSAPGSLGQLLQGAAEGTGLHQELLEWPLLHQGLTRLGVAWDPAWGSVVVVAAPVLVLLTAVWKLGWLAWAVWCSKFSVAVVSQAVDDCLKPVGWGIILLAALG